MLRTILLTLHAPLALGLFGLSSLLTVAAGTLAQVPLLPFDRARRACLRANHLFWGRFFWWIEPSLRMRRRGLEHARGGPFVIVCNHASVMDIPACMGLPLPLRVVARREFFRVPVLGWYMRFSRQIRIHA